LKSVSDSPGNTHVFPTGDCTEQKARKAKGEPSGVNLIDYPCCAHASIKRLIPKYDGGVPKPV
jgi:hypothetical protein